MFISALLILIVLMHPHLKILVDQPSRTCGIKHNVKPALAAKAPSFKGHGNQHETFPTTRNHSWCFFQRCESVVTHTVFFVGKTIPDITKTLKPNWTGAKAQRMAQPKKAKKSLSWVYLIISLVTAVGLAKSCCNCSALCFHSRCSSISSQSHHAFWLPKKDADFRIPSTHTCLRHHL